MPIRILLVGIMFSWGCASTPKKAEPTPVTESAVTVEAPADLKACPCGRTDWEQLPPGHKKAPK